MPVETDAELADVLSHDRIAVVGCSSTPGKAAHDVPKYMRSHGYDVIPVNPYADEIFGEEAYDDVREVPGEVDVVNVFRPSEEVSEIVDATLERDDVEVVWTQLNIRDDDAAARAEEEGLQVVQDRCLKVEHRRLT